MLNHISVLLKETIESEEIDKEYKDFTEDK